MLYNESSGRLAMPLKKSTRNEIQRFIIEAAERHPHDLVRIASAYFKVSGQSIRNYIDKLVAKDILQVSGKKKGIRYGLKAHEKQFATYVSKDLDESKIWETEIVPFLPKLKENVYFVCNYGYTEMLNNIKDHSGSAFAYSMVSYNALEIEFALLDNGVGIFSKIQKDFNLENKKDAILELAKGKLTSDPENHTGEGIFFTSRLFDKFDILSENLFFHGHDKDDWLLEAENFGNGTAVFMKIKRDSNTDYNEIFGKYANPELDDYGFSRTHLPVKLLQHEGEALVSRSQAKRLVARFGQFREVILDFSGINHIGQGFADEIFRVFMNNHPEVNLSPINMSEQVKQTINHVLARRQSALF